MQGHPLSARGRLPKRRRPARSTVGSMIDRAVWLSCWVALSLGAAGCGGAAPSSPRHSSQGRVPDLVGLSLDEAEEKLGERGLEDYVYAEHKVIIRSNWTVCGQVPGPGERAAAVDLYVGHFSCDGDD
jgi:hypothetical protein